jgi:two-component system, LytTR family, sensor kinase
MLALKKGEPTYALALYFANRALKKEKELRLNQEESFKLKEKQFQLQQQQLHKEEENQQLQQQKMELEKKQLQLEQESLQYQYAFLRSQMNPHTLQNLLNMLVSKLLKAGVPEVVDPMMMLSKIMRYSMDVKTNEKGRVLLVNEIEHIHNMLKMNEYRTTIPICLDFKSEGEVESAEIIPLIIIPFIENAIKYAQMDDPQHPIKIYIAVHNNRFSFYTNNKSKTAKTVLDEGSTSHGIGLSNTRQRLNASYGIDGYELKMESLGDFFTLTLIIFNLNTEPKVVFQNIL